MKYFSLIIFGLLFTTECYAGVRALGGGGTSKGARSTEYNNALSENTNTAPVVNLKNTNTVIICRNSGFTLQKCPAGYAPVYPCQQNNKYFRDCCPQEYRYTSANCYEKGMEPSQETCLGFHACHKPEANTEPKTEQKTELKTEHKKDYKGPPKIHKQ